MTPRPSRQVELVRLFIFMWPTVPFTSRTAQPATKQEKFKPTLFSLSGVQAEGVMDAYFMFGRQGTKICSIAGQKASVVKRKKLYSRTKMAYLIM